MFRVGGCLNRLASSSPCSTFPSPSAADVSLIPALVSRSKWKISKTDIYTPLPARPRPRKILITGYSREEKRIGREKRILFSYRVTLSFFTTDRSIHRSRDELRFCFSKPRIESSRVESLVKQSTSKTWDRIGLERAHPFSAHHVHPSRQLLVVPSAQPFPSLPLPEYRFVGHYRELPMENVIDSV